MKKTKNNEISIRVDGGFMYVIGLFLGLLIGIMVR